MLWIQKMAMITQHCEDTKNHRTVRYNIAKVRVLVSVNIIPIRKNQTIAQKQTKSHGW